MLVVDLMHEFELGVWKQLFAHLIRILDTVKGTAVRPSPTTLLNQRYELHAITSTTRN